MAISSRRVSLKFTRQLFYLLPHLSTSSSSSAASDTIAGNGMGRHVNRQLEGCHLPFAASFKRGLSATVGSQLPVITDPNIKDVFKDLMVVNWDEIPDSVVNETNKVLSKTTDNVAGKEALENVFRAAKASVEFGSTLVSLRMALDDLSGITGENVEHLPDGLEDAMVAAYKRYSTYLDSFGPDETYLRKKVETELGTKMIHLKMRCSGIGSEWGKAILALQNLTTIIVSTGRLIYSRLLVLHSFHGSCEVFKILYAIFSLNWKVLILDTPVNQLLILHYIDQDVLNLLTLDPSNAQIALLGTSGISGSYVEH